MTLFHVYLIIFHSLCWCVDLRVTQSGLHLVHYCHRGQGVGQDVRARPRWRHFSHFELLVLGPHRHQVYYTRYYGPNHHHQEDDNLPPLLPFILLSLWHHGGYIYSTLALLMIAFSRKKL